MSRETSPYIVGDFWLDKRRDGRAQKIWQIARAERGTVIYRSTGKVDLDEAKAELEAHLLQLRSLSKQQANEANVIAHLVNYWKERGQNLTNHDQTNRSLRTFAAFLMQDKAGVGAVVTDLTPLLFERFRKWRMGPHSFNLEWFGEVYDYASEGVKGATVQRNINDVRAAINHAEDNLRIDRAPKIKDVEQRYQSPPKDRLLTESEMARIAWYAFHNADLFRFVALQMVTSVRPQAALKFDPRLQYDDRSGLIDLQPANTPQTKKRNAIIPAIRPMRVVLRAWAKEGPKTVTTRKTAWRIMRRTLDLSEDVKPKTIRYTVATWLYEMEWVPERQISEMLGHIDDIGLARTSRIYAKYRPEQMGKVVKGLTMIWMKISRLARAYSSDHILTTVGQGGRNVVLAKSKKALETSR